jgi:hypothetical protein
MSYRRGSVFVRDVRAASRPLSRAEIARTLYVAEQLELRTKAPGRRNGALGQSGLAILRCLLLRFLHRSTGALFPSYSAIQEATGFCRQTVARALRRLELVGLLTTVRRLTRTVVDGRMIVRQTSNLYRVNDARADLHSATEGPSGDSLRLARRPFHKSVMSAAEAGLRAESTQRTETIPEIYIPEITSWRNAPDWRERARSCLKRAFERV